MQHEQFVRRIKARAAELGISMTDLYRDCQITSGTVSQWKNGLTNPRLVNILRIAEYLRTTPDYLLGKTEQKEIPVPTNEDGLTKLQKELIEVVRLLPDESVAVLLAAAKAQLDIRKSLDAQ